MSKRERVTVILGAGASHDCWNEQAPRDDQWLPPLASQLFVYRTSFWSILQQYPGAAAIQVDLGPRSAMGPLSIEQALRELAQHPNDLVRRQYRDVPPYLRDVLYECSEKYVPPAPGVYGQLIRSLLFDSDFEVMFLTLNYDTLLEQALRMQDPSYTFKSMEDYVQSARQAKVVKLHGSVDWFVPIGLVSDGPWSEAVDGFNGDLTRRQIARIDPIGTAANAREAGRWIYPAVTAPLAGKDPKEIVCPRAHQAEMIDFLNQCYRYLFIGTSGLDDDLLAILAQHVPEQSLAHYVGVGDLKEVVGRIDHRVPQFRTLSSMAGLGYMNGFKSYVLSEEFSEFLRPLDDQIRGRGRVGVLASQL